MHIPLACPPLPARLWLPRLPHCTQGQGQTLPRGSQGPSGSVPTASPAFPFNGHPTPTTCLSHTDPPASPTPCLPPECGSVVEKLLVMSRPPAPGPQRGILLLSSLQGLVGELGPGARSPGGHDSCSLLENLKLVSKGGI